LSGSSADDNPESNRVEHRALIEFSVSSAPDDEFLLITKHEADGTSETKFESAWHVIPAGIGVTQSIALPPDD
jgi:hypothetical protein